MFTSFLFANILKEGDFLMGVDKKWGMVFLGEKKKENRFFFQITLPEVRVTYTQYYGSPSMGSEPK